MWFKFLSFTSLCWDGSFESCTKYWHGHSESCSSAAEKRAHSEKLELGPAGQGEQHRRLQPGLLSVLCCHLMGDRECHTALRPLPCLLPQCHRLLDCFPYSNQLSK